MDDIKKAQQRLVNAIVAIYPQLSVGDEKQEELYLAMHDLTSKMAKLNGCGGECSNENSGLHLQRVSGSLPDDVPLFIDWLDKYYTHAGNDDLYKRKDNGTIEPQRKLYKDYCRAYKLK